MTAPAVLTVEQLEELDSKPLVRWDVVDKSRALETARAYHRLTSAIAFRLDQTPEEFVDDARDMGWKDPQ